MATLTRPTWFRPSQCQLALRKSGLQFASPFNGTLQAIDTLAERWVMTLDLPGAADGGARSAFFSQWAGGVNRVPLFHVGRPQPRGTLRGAPTVATAAARGNTTLALAGALGANAILNGSFEVDTNADGLADTWTRYSAGSTGTLTAALDTDGTYIVHGTRSQFLRAAALAAGGGNLHGIYRTGVPVSQLAGQTVTLAAQVAGTMGTTLAIYATWQDAGGGAIGGADIFASVTANGGVQQLAGSVACPPGAVTAYVEVRQANGSGGVAAIYVDGVRLVSGASSPSYPGGATLLAGDMLGAGGQLFMVAADCTATDAGALTVPLVNRVRGTIAASSAVTWDRPTAEFVLPAMEVATTWQRPGVVAGTAIDVLEWF